MNAPYDEIPTTLQSLADRFCERRAYSCLLRFLPAYFAPNGLTDGWEDEAQDLHKAMNLIDRMLVDR